MDKLNAEMSAHHIVLVDPQLECVEEAKALRRQSVN